MLNNPVISSIRVWSEGVPMAASRLTGDGGREKATRFRLNRLHLLGRLLH